MSNLRLLAAAGPASCCLGAGGAPGLGVSVEDLVRELPPTPLSTSGYEVTEQPLSALSPWGPGPSASGDFSPLPGPVKLDLPLAAPPPQPSFPIKQDQQT